MNLTNSLLWDLVTEYAVLRPQIYFKSSLVALARAMQDLVLSDEQEFLVIANFQQEKYFRQIERRFSKMAIRSKHVYILGVPDLESGFALDNLSYETIPLLATDTLAGERYLVVIGQQYSACLVVQEKLDFEDLSEFSPIAEQKSRYEGIWTFDREISYTAADWLLGRIANFRPELRAKTEQARNLFITKRKINNQVIASQSIDLGIFTRSLVTHLQSGQYKLFKAYKAIATAERKEVLSSKIAAAQRSSLNPEEILSTTVKELGQLFPHCRCLLYRINPDLPEVKIEYESVPKSMVSLVGQTWSIADNPLFISAQAQRSTLIIDNVSSNPYLRENPVLKAKITRAGIHSWLMVSIRYQGTLLGMLELHYGVNHNGQNIQWQTEDIALIEAVATSAGIALIQASSYYNLVELNAQLEAVERIQSNLIAIVGHELRTPLSTIQICLESLASEPDMSLDLKNSMLDIALKDAERLKQLVQNFLTLSKLEAGKASLHMEFLTIDYALNLALNSLQTTTKVNQLPVIKLDLPTKLPEVLADVDGLVEVFTKLLDNACKFTPAHGEVTVTAQLQILQKSKMLEVVIADTGRGIATELLETIFHPFAQSEGYLRRTVSGAGLGLVICRQIVQSMGGRIWATSEGENLGSQLHITLPCPS